MTDIKGKILDGERAVLVFHKKENPPVAVGDEVQLLNRTFRVQSLEGAHGVVCAGVDELTANERDYSHTRHDWFGSRYEVYIDIAQVRGVRP